MQIHPGDVLADDMQIQGGADATATANAASQAIAQAIATAFASASSKTTVQGTWCSAFWHDK